VQSAREKDQIGLGFRRRDIDRFSNSH
jgi:hypothetical protein